MTPKLSTRARNLSQRRKNRNQGEGVDLSGQDSSLKDWVPADQHRDYQEGSEEEDEEEETPATAERGREQQATAA